jgi:cation diffusion facilitator family transporter
MKARRLKQRPLAHFALLSVAAAVATIGLKIAAYALTGSVGLLSDAIESGVNLIGAVVALAMLIVAARPADEEHPYGHAKAEYFSSGVEGTLIVIAAIGIGFTAVRRLMYPRPVEQAAVGIAVSFFASLINLAVARILMTEGKRHRSITLEADGRHLMTDVWTSAGVFAGIAAVAVTGWSVLDPIVALAVAGNIVRTGAVLMRRSVQGLMDSALPEDERRAVEAVLNRYRKSGVRFHALQTRQAAARRFLSIHVLVPGTWTVTRGHRLSERVQTDVAEAVPGLTVTTHLEPADDKIESSWEESGR